MIKAPVWTKEQLEKDRLVGIEDFRRRRMEEPLDDYLKAFDQYRGNVEDLLELTLDLTDLDKQQTAIIKDQQLLHALRYLPGPPISADDLKIVADAVLTPAKLKNDAAMAQRIFEVIFSGLDHRRFPWVMDGREPKDEAERDAAVLATTALMATRKMETDRRNIEKKHQENEVMDTLTAAGLKKVKTRHVTATLTHAPAPGEFCAESKLGTRKADIIVGLWDHRVMAIECKVSNSSTNSVKRLNNDAAAKAEKWFTDFGKVPVIPTAVLSGVYKLHNLEDAQDRGLTLFWAHDLQQLVDWIAATKKP